MEQAILEALASGGPVVILAGIVFLMYRRDRESSERRIAEICAGHEKRLEEYHEKLEAIVGREQDTREAQTRALQDLTTTLERMNGRH